MYGLINSALKSMVIDRFGEDTWDAILNHSGVPTDAFLTMRAYDDSITFRLVAAASEILETPAETCLELFGEYWVLDIATKHYGSLMDAAGTNLIGFLENLNGLHDRITSVFLDYVPPEFQVEKLEDSQYRIHYISQREGLTAFVDGLLLGLSKHFDETLTVLGKEHAGTASGTHAIYRVNISP